MKIEKIKLSDLEHNILLPSQDTEYRANILGVIVNLNLTQCEIVNKFLLFILSGLSSRLVFRSGLKDDYAKRILKFLFSIRYSKFESCELKSLCKNDLYLLLPCFHSNNNAKKDSEIEKFIRKKLANAIIKFWRTFKENDSCKFISDIKPDKQRINYEIGYETISKYEIFSLVYVLTGDSLFPKKEKHLYDNFIEKFRKNLDDPFIKNSIDCFFREMKLIKENVKEENKKAQTEYLAKIEKNRANGEAKLLELNNLFQEVFSIDCN
jgi:hypothetical protein